jgi:hypothetical protein
MLSMSILVLKKFYRKLTFYFAYEFLFLTFIKAPKSFQPQQSKQAIISVDWQELGMIEHKKTWK